MKFHCGPTATLRNLPRGVIPIALYEQPSRAGMGSAGTAIIERCRKLGLASNARAWDFLSIAISAVTADAGVARGTSADGWTRELELTVAVIDPAFWNQQITTVNSFLRFLTGDIWHVDFVAGGVLPAAPARLIARPEDAVTLLSGGLDSLIGTLDRTLEGKRLVAVSQVSAGDKSEQSTLAQSIGGGLFHLQLNHNARPPEAEDRSQRARSIAFIAFGVLAATALDRYHSGETITLYIPENGFISLNIPLTPARLGSLSTRTTHPSYLRQVQALLDAAGLRVQLLNPYQLKTKGEMLSECRDQAFLRRYAADTTSCGRFARNGFQHCGRCLPCLIRRAAFQRWGQRDSTQYKHANLSIRNSANKNFIDVRAAGIAVERVRQHGLDRWIGGALSTAQLGDISAYQDVARRGLEELGGFLAAARAL
jgi:hypothetical protein